MSEQRRPTPPQEDETLVSLSDSGRSFSADDTLPEGLKIGKYRVQHLIGRGGMGAVYQAEDTILRREVALKILPKSLTEDQQALKRFIREAQAAARLNHPNVVMVHEIGRKGDVYFIAMELVRGEGCDQILKKRGPLPLPEATNLAISASKALHAAHKAGLVHRDIKPANILRAEDGSIKIGDFGLAKLHTAGDATLTQKDMVIGTPKYMSPEQCNNENIDGRSDIYSLGATFYALLTGSAPFDQGTTMQILFAHCSQPVPDPREVNQSLPPACAAVINKAMAKQPDERYQSAKEMLGDLQKLAGIATDPSLGATVLAASAHGAAAAEPESGDSSFASLLDSLDTNDSRSILPQQMTQMTPHSGRSMSAALIAIAVIGAGALIAIAIVVAVLFANQPAAPPQPMAAASPKAPAQASAGPSQLAPARRGPVAAPTEATGEPSPEPARAASLTASQPAATAPEEPVPAEQPMVSPAAAVAAEGVPAPREEPDELAEADAPPPPPIHVPPAAPAQTAAADDVTSPPADAEDAQHVDAVTERLRKRVAAAKKALEQAQAANDRAKFHTAITYLSRLHVQLMGSAVPEQQELAAEIKQVLDANAPTRTGGRDDRRPPRDDEGARRPPPRR